MTNIPRLLLHFSKQLIVPHKRFMMNPGSLSTPTPVLSGYATVTYVTAPSQDEANRIAEQLVRNRLAACVNIVRNVESIYEWEGRVQRESEYLLVIKSHSDKTKELTEFVESNHPYDCPEVVSLKIDSGSKKYLEWIAESTAKEILEDTDDSSCL